ncbi:carbohydrate-binding protein [Solwaraspora sp. WMMA2065]|uniref:carbohydrate-binding protein n=1 Tax=Solwaraspora sp. WMMA2065 TaxID=3015166 RepID=UPI00338D9B01
MTVLQVPTSRGMCCHVGGDIDFDADGNLYLSTGDDTNPFDSSGYTPIDERSNRNPAYDAQRTAGNSNDLRGKVLRIRPSANGGYTIPAGNMFPAGTANTKPEIYAMGFRNPFRMSVDKATGVVYLGEYGPDAGTADPNRGPANHVAFERIAQPGFYGWPYCSNYNTPYIDFTFPSGPSGAPFNCSGGPVNNSPNNSGITQLPPSQRAWLPYGGEQNPPELCCGSLSPMDAVVYNYDASLASDVKFPASMDGKVFIGEFGRRWIKTVTVTGSGGGRSPIAAASADPTTGNAPLTVQFSSAGTSDPDGDAITYAWDFTTDGSTDSTQPNPSYTYTSNGEFTATLTVRDSTGRSATASVVIGVGRPTVTLDLPRNGRLFEFGDAIPFEVTVTDPDVSTIDCSRVKVNYLLGHDSHAHGISSATGCSGTLQTTEDGEHDPNANIFGVMIAEYTPVGATIPVTSTQTVLQPRTRQAEHYGDQQGTTLVEKASAHGGSAVGYIENGDWISFTPYNLAGATSFPARVASAGSGGTISLRTGSASGPVIGTATVSPTGDWETWTAVTGTLTPPSGTQQLFLVFTGGSSYLFDVDEFTFRGGGTTPPPSTGPSCSAAYSVIGQWQGGFQGEVRVTAGSTSSGWTVTWTFNGGQTVSQSWSATVTSSGANVTARNVSYNGSLGAGASTTFGFIGSGNNGANVSSLSCTAS